jgi:acetolactate decarboxylase
MTVRQTSTAQKPGQTAFGPTTASSPSRRLPGGWRLISGLLLGLLLGHAWAQERSTDVLYQVSTIDALLAGVYDGVATVGEVLEHGGFGIGTFEALDGEMIALDGVVYQAASDGSVNRMPADTRTPFMAVTRFAPDQQVSLTGPLDLAGFQAQVQARLPSRNLFYAVHADAGFAHIRYRSVARQVKPYAPLAAVVEQQAIFEQRDVAGTLIGFWCPAFAKGLNVPGFHLHFLSADRKHGGHVLGFTLDEVRVRLDHTDGWEIALPATPGYLQADLQDDRSAELHAVEQARLPKAD